MHLFSLDAVPIVGSGRGRLVQPGRTQSWDEGSDVQKHEWEEGGVSNSRRQERGTEDADLMNMATDSAPLSLQDPRDQEDGRGVPGALHPSLHVRNQSLTGQFRCRGPEGELMTDCSRSPLQSTSNVIPLVAG